MGPLIEFLREHPRLTAGALGYLFAIVWAKHEQLLIDDPPEGIGMDLPDWNALLGHWSKKYVVPMVLLFTIAGAMQGPEWRLVPSQLAVEDLAYFTFTWQDSLSENTWITGTLGGLHLGGRIYIPTIYLILHGATAALYLYT